jgi:tight adherence protein B
VSTTLVLVFAAGVFLVYDSATRPSGREPRRRLRYEERWASWSAGAGLGAVSPRQFAAACAGAGLSAALLAGFVFGSATVALIAFVAGAYVPLGYFRARRRNRRRALLHCWPEAIELLAGAVRAGDTLPAAVAVVAERGPASLRPAFRGLVADHRVSGDLVGALERLGDAMGDATADRVVVTLTAAHRVGGQELGRVLRTLAAFLREDLAVRKEIEARQSWTLVAARVAAGAPWLVLLLVASRPQAMRAYDSMAGLVVLVCGAVATVLGYRLMVALGRLPEEPRVLGTGP